MTIEEDLLKKVAAVLVKEKRCRYKLFAWKIKTGDDTPNNSDEEDNLDYHKESKHKSPANEQRQKKVKSDINVESSAMQLPIPNKLPEKLQIERAMNSNPLK